MKKIISLTVLLLIVLGSLVVFPAGAEAMITSGETGECDWNFNIGTGELTVSGEGEMWDCEIEFDKGYPTWYKYRNKIKTVIIEEGVTSVGDYSFDMCENLKKVIMSNTLTRIGKNAFSYCYNLKDIVFPEKAVGLIINSSAFSHCKKLKSIFLPDGVDYIGDWAFFGCGLTKIQIPETIKKLEKTLFVIVIH